MLRSFVGGKGADPGRLRAALEREGQVELLEAGPWKIAFTGSAPPEPEAGAPVCLLDGEIYEAVGLHLPARDGPELESFLSRACVDGAHDALLRRLRGDFVVVFLDPLTGRGLIARDQMGGRSAVWHRAPHRLLFASEYHPLVRALPRRPDPDPVSVAHWIGISGLPGDRSLYTDVRRVEAGCGLRLDGLRAERFRYWSPSPGEASRGDRGTLVDALRAALARATERRVGPGERAAVLLSGGLDSGTVAALAARGPADRRPRAAYSATFPEHQGVDEAHLITEVASALGLPSTTISVRGGSILEGALVYLRRHEVPPVSPNLFFWNPLLRRAAEDGVEVMLDGEGGDELFGLSGYLLADRLRRGRLFASVALINRMPTWQGRASRAVPFYLRTYGLKGLAPFRLHDAVRRARGPQRYAPPWMRPEASADLAASDDRHRWKQEPGPRWLADLIHRVTRGMGPALGYDHVRRRAALAGVAPRHPLIDVDVIELVLSFPPELAFDRTWSRPLLRECVAGLLPDSVRLRPEKSNFDAIFHDALTGADLDAVQALLCRSDAEVGAYVDLDQVGAMIEAPPQAGPARMWWALHVWRLLTAECFLLGQTGPEAIAQRLPRAREDPRVELSAPRRLPAPG